MKVKHFVADNMRKAMARMREELGPDAVILTTRKMDDGVEIVAAVDYNEQEINTAFASPHPATDEGLNFTIDEIVADSRATLAEEANSQTLAILSMREELNRLSALMENQAKAISWDHWVRHNPYRVDLLQRLTGLGLESQFASDIIDELSRQHEIPQNIQDAWQLVLAWLRSKILVKNTDNILTNGGIVALVGATGVGKTLTIAKLAAYYSILHGRDTVVLVSMDNYRIGAHHQLLSFGRILNIPVLAASGKEELHHILSNSGAKKLVLIDTAGLGQRDLRLAGQMELLQSNEHPVHHYLTLSATTQMSALNDIIRAYTRFDLQGCIITKEDEAVSLGNILTAVIKYALPVAYVTDGQRVPNDIIPADAEELINKAIGLAERADNIVNDEIMAMKLGAMRARVGGL